MTALRHTLKKLLRRRFGDLSASLEARIDATGDAAKLEYGIENIFDLDSPDELAL